MKFAVASNTVGLSVTVEFRESRSLAEISLASACELYCFAVACFELLKTSNNDLSDQLHHYRVKRPFEAIITTYAYLDTYEDRNCYLLCMGKSNEVSDGITPSHWMVARRIACLFSPSGREGGRLPER